MESSQNKGKKGRTGGSERRALPISRFTQEEKDRALALVVSGMKQTEVAREIGSSTESIRLWMNRAKAEGRIPSLPAVSPESNNEPLEQDSCGRSDLCEVKATSPSTAPHDPACGLSAGETQAILELKKQHPTMGPPQIRAQLKRFKGWRISVKAIGRLLRQHGYELEHRSGRPKDYKPQRFEAPHPNALWQLDFMELRMKTGRLFLLLTLDDFSRFLVAHRLTEEPTSETVVGTIQGAIRLHGKPEAVYTDRAGAFLAWRNKSGFQNFLESNLIDHHVSKPYRPQGRGKIESLVRTIRKELWDVHEFHSKEELGKALDEFATRYNYNRAHLGIDGLTPADRYFGRWPQVLDRINALSRGRNDHTALRGDSPFTDEYGDAMSPVELIRLINNRGKLEIRLFGHRVVLGEIETS